MKKLTIILITLVVFSAAFFAWALFSSIKQESPAEQNTAVENLPAVISSLEAKTSDEGEVKITVQPENLAGNDATWNFNILLDTHSAELVEDMTLVSALIGDDGAKYAPIGWEGDPPGGHHRGGVLKFKAVTPPLSSITLTIRDVGDVKERKFTWQLKGQ